ncbi:MAG: branched-chain amino acid ABC transporter substrate-binding protein [Alphaproteobacteria bacterium]|nr:branched-chain amino acid ABC transporter substrate-binding protein [Alphaproteobacteria bacterium]
MSTLRKTAVSAAVGIAMAASAGLAFAAEPIKIAFIDPLSGPFATTGESGLRSFEFAVDELVNKNGGVLGGRMMEIVPLDNKISPKESLIQLKRAISDGIQFIAQGNSSGVANALTDAVEKHNKRNPDQRVLFLNYSAVDPALTNDKCNFWHFRFDANADIKMDALTDVIAKNANIKKVYIIGQDYSFGKAVAAAAVSDLGKKRPDVEIVGNELHPIGKVKDFTPYATKIKASGADAVITGNWGADMVGLGKAIIESGVDSPIYTYYAAHDGITATFGPLGEGIIRSVREGALNPPAPAFKMLNDKFKAKYPNNDLNQARIFNVVEMLAKAIEKAGSTDPVKVGLALEGMEYDSIMGGKVIMRAKDHQAIQDIYITVHTNKGVVIDADNSGYGLVTESSVPMAGLNSATSCKMERPS